MRPLISLLFTLLVLAGCASKSADLAVERTVDPSLGLDRTTVIVPIDQNHLAAVKGQDNLFALETVPSVARRVGGTDIAINADFFEPDSSPTGMFVNERGIWRGPWIGGHATGAQRPVMAWNGDNDVFLGLPDAELRLQGPDGDVLVINGINVVQEAELADWQGPLVMAYNDLYGTRAPAAPDGGDAVALRIDRAPWLPNKTTSVIVEGPADAGLRLERTRIVLTSTEPLPEWLDAGATCLLEARMPVLDGPVVGVLGALPQLVADGRNVANEAAAREGFPLTVAVSRQPRSAIGLRTNSEGRRELVVVAWDGRHPERVGATLSELAEYFLSLDCTQAINFDGGGSTVLVIDGNVANNPSDIDEDGTTRAVGNVLLIRGKS